MGFIEIFSKLLPPVSLIDLSSLCITELYEFMRRHLNKEFHRYASINQYSVCPN